MAQDREASRPKEGLALKVLYHWWRTRTLQVGAKCGMPRHATANTNMQAIQHVRGDATKTGSHKSIQMFRPLTMNYCAWLCYWLYGALRVYQAFDEGVQSLKQNMHNKTNFNAQATH